MIAEFRGVHARGEFQAGRHSVLAMIRRRPCSIQDIAEGLGMHRNAVLKYIEELDERGLVGSKSVGAKVFYLGKHPAADG